MYKLLSLVLSLALFAAACGGGSDTASVETDSAAANEGSAAPADCGFDADLTADEFEIDQIPGDGRDDSPSALLSYDHPSFPPPLVDVTSIRSGGPPPDGIPPVDRPVFQTANTVDWIRCNEPVLSLQVDGETRAYPVQIMTWHELVNDTFGDQAVTVSYCPLCNSSVAYNRQVGDRTLTFGTSGRLFNSSLVMYDRETESLWTHFNGAAVVGELTGTQLELLPMQTTSWQSYLEANPEGKVLTRNTGFERRYGENPYFGYDDVNTSPFLFDGESDPRLAAKERVVGLRSGDDSLAVVLSELSTAGVLAVEVDGEPVTVWHLPGTASALEQDAIADGRDVGAVGTFAPFVNGSLVTFERTDAGFVDSETGSTWNIAGLAVDGELAGMQLEPVEHLDTFWFAFAAFAPDTRVFMS